MLHFGRAKETSWLALRKGRSGKPVRLSRYVLPWEGREGASVSGTESGARSTSATRVFQPSVAGHLQIARIDHWFKNVFVLPGIVVGLGFSSPWAGADLAVRIVLGLISICLVVSSNYTLNELLDAPFDRHHPKKFARAVPSGRVSIPLGYLQWAALIDRKSTRLNSSHGYISYSLFFFKKIT